MSEAIQYYTDIDLNQGQLINAGFQLSEIAPVDPVVGQFYYNTGSDQFLGYNGVEWVDLGLILASPITIRGVIANADTDPPAPLNPAIGDSYVIITTAGTVGGMAVEVGDQILYTQDGWIVIPANLRFATETLAGYIRLATQAETNSGMPGLAVTPQTLAGYLSQFMYSKLSINVIGTLTARTPRVVTHDLNLIAADNINFTIWHDGSPIWLAVKALTASTAQVESNKTLNNVKIVFNG